MDQHQKHTFQYEFCVEIWITGKTPKQLKRSKKIENQIYGFKMAANKLFEISRHQLSRQKWENQFPEGIFLRNLAHK